MGVVSPKVLIAFAAAGSLFVLVSLYSLHREEVSRMPLVKDLALSRLSEHTARLFSSSARSASSLLSGLGLFGRMDEATRVALVEHSNALARKLVPQLSHGSVISPLALAFSLSVVQHGSAGTTQQELSSLLGGMYSLDELRALDELFGNNASSAARMTQTLLLNTHHVKLVNASYVAHTAAPLLHVFSANLDKDSDLRGVARDVDNLFATNTHWRLQYVGKRLVKSKQSMALLHTLYFHAQWAAPCQWVPGHVTQMNFTRESGQRRVIHTLCMVVPSLPYFENDRLQLFELAFRDEDYAMGFFVPRFEPTPQRKRPPSLLSENAAQLFSYIDQLRPYEDVKDAAGIAAGEVEVRIPKMRTEKTHRLAPKVLQRLGVRDAFDAAKNEQSFSGVAKAGAMLSDVVQEAVLVVDEFGANSLREWQSESAVALRRQSAFGAAAAQRPVVEVKHTFLYYVRHKPTNLLLLIGDFDG